MGKPKKMGLAPEAKGAASLSLGGGTRVLCSGVAEEFYHVGEGMTLAKPNEMPSSHLS